jgi:hypothetical protein
VARAAVANRQAGSQYRQGGLGRVRFIAASARAIDMGILLLIGIIAAFTYYLSLKVYPSTKCKQCNGGGGHFSTFRPNSDRKCRKCGGTGRVDRLGAKVFLSRKNDS